MKIFISQQRVSGHERFNVTLSDAGVRGPSSSVTCRWLRSTRTTARQEACRPEDVVGRAAGVGVMLDDLQAGVVGEKPVHHVRCL
jgi:hypothetical protein